MKDEFESEHAVPAPRKEDQLFRLAQTEISRIALQPSDRSTPDSNSRCSRGGRLPSERELALPEPQQDGGGLQQAFQQAAAESDGQVAAHPRQG